MLDNSMALFTNDGLDLMTRYVLGIETQFSLSLHLYTNNQTPTVNDTLQNYTECTLAGYSSIDLTPSKWVGSTSGGLSSYSYPTQTYQFASYQTPPQTIYGWYLMEINTLTLIAAEAIVPAYPVPAGGGTFSLTISWGETNC